MNALTMEALTFDQMGLRRELLQAVTEKGFETPTPIQQQAIPAALTGRDVMGQAQTGTGKTAAFGLPILNHITPGSGLQGLVVCPTRELAVQVAEEIASLGKKLAISTLAVYGGQSIELQIRALKKHPELVVGTPGRLLDHLRRRTIRLNLLSHVVLDEADEMLNMGFLEDIEAILAQCPEEKTTFLFSATFPPDIRNLAKTFLKDPLMIEIKQQEKTEPLIEQRYYEVNPKQKVETLCRILDVEQPPVALIFCRTKRGVDDLVSAMEIRGYATNALHGDMSQRERDAVIGKFRQGIVEILVATDVAARGLDISHVTHVVNFDIPQDPDSYVHRIGRTGRAGRHGTAITLVEPRELKQLRYIQHVTNKKINRTFLPTLADALEIRKQHLASQLVKATEESLGEFTDLANELLEEHDSTYLVAAALKLLSDQGRKLETAELEPVPTAGNIVKIPRGRMHGMRASNLVNLITSRTKIRPRQIGDIEIHDSYTTVEVPEEYVGLVRSLFKAPPQNKSLPPGVKPKGRTTTKAKPKW